MNLDMHTMWWHVKNLEVDGDDSEGISRLPACDFDIRNLARMRTNPGRARRILGMTTKQTSTENLVMGVEK